MMTQPRTPWTAPEVLDAYFLEARAKLLEVAATLDRVDRATQAKVVASDSRIVFIQEALKILQGNAPNRAELIQRLYSKN